MPWQNGWKSGTTHENIGTERIPGALGLHQLQSNHGGVSEPEGCAKHALS